MLPGEFFDRILIWFFVAFVLFKVIFGFIDFYSHNTISGILFFISSLPLIFLSIYCVTVSVKFWICIALGKLSFHKSNLGALVLILIPIGICSLLAALFFNSNVPYHFSYGFIWVGFIFFFFTLPFKLQD